MALYKQDFAICPWCNGESGCRVDHLYNDHWGGFGPWACKECRRHFRGKVNAPGEVTVERDKDATFTSRQMVLLKIEGKACPVYFVMDHPRYHHNGKVESDEERQGSTQFFFEEHSCPTNWLDECVAVIDDGDCDPHGFLEFVRAVDVPDDFDTDNDANWITLFPEAFPADKSIDGELTPAMLQKP